MRGGRVFTGDGWTDAVAIGGDRVLAIGADAQALVGTNTRVISLEGRMALPGFHDAHTHLIGGALAEDGLDLEGVESADDLAGRVAAWIAEHGDDAWVTGRGWDADRFAGRVLPRKEDLDRVARSTPVLLRRRDGHAALANSRALALAGIRADTPDPPGGRIVREDGRVTGILLEDPAIDLVRNLIPSASSERVERAVRRALERAAALGITSIQDDPSYDDALRPAELYASLYGQGALTARISIWRKLGRPFDALRAEEERLAASVAPADRLRYGLLKGYLDGSLGSRTAQLFEPYDDDDRAGTGIDLDEAGELFEHTKRASAAGYQVGLHAIGDRAAARALDAFGACPETARARHRIEHAQLFRPQDLERVAALGAVASVQPIHLASDMLVAEARLGSTRCETAHPWASLARAGTLLAFGTDYPVEPIDPLPGLVCAVTRRSPRQFGLAPFQPQESLDLEAALEAYTLGGARASHQEDTLGRLAPGYLADVAVLSGDLMALPPAEWVDLRCDLTIFAGQVVFEA